MGEGKEGYRSVEVRMRNERGDEIEKVHVRVRVREVV